MALKGDRVIIETDITNTCASVTNRGVILVNTTMGSGVAIGTKAGISSVPSNPSGFKPTGLLLNDVVNIDQTRYHKNFHKDETMVNERCNLLRKGRVTTDQVTGSPNYGDTAYLTTNGQVTPTVSATGGIAATPKVGVFQGNKDENGFVCLDVNLPIA